MRTDTRNWTDATLEAAIRSTSREREAALRHLFFDSHLMDMVRKYAVAHGGTDADGEDLFQDAFVLFDRNVRQGKFNGQGKLSTYFFAIAKWHWVTVRRKQRPKVAFDGLQQEGDVAPVDVQVIEADHRDLLHEALSTVGEKCKKLLLLTGLTASNEEIAEAAGFSSAAMAKKSVYRCREQFRGLIRQHPGLAAVLKSIIRK